VYATTAALLAQGKLAVILGGDHSVPFGAIRAYAETYPGLGILHLDAHADLREAYEGFTWSHASIFNNVMRRIDGVGKLVQVGVRDLGQSERAMIDESRGRIVTFYDAELAARKEEGVPFARLADEIVALPATGQGTSSSTSDGARILLLALTGLVLLATAAISLRRRFL
jgi:agmatinase